MRTERDREDAAAALAARLTEEGVEGIALTFVDNAGVARVKGVPVARLAEIATHGVGMSPVFDAFGADDSITSSPSAGGPVGDLRLVPDIERVVALAAQHGFAWAPVVRVDQSGAPHPQCSRTVLATQVDRAAARGLSLRMGFETEFVVSCSSREVEPATVAPAYGAARLVDLSDLCVELLRALRDQGIEVLQLHPEYAPGQFEVSTAPNDPVGAADDCVLVRQTIRGVVARHGLAATFSPAVDVGAVGNGCHLHVGAWSDGANVFARGEGPFGMAPEGESFLAGLLEQLPALLAVGAPSVASYLRLVPGRWAAPFRCWGLENREAALRLITGEPTEQQHDANVELKVFDATANPYLLAASVIAAGLAGLDDEGHLPPPVLVDPASLDVADQPSRLPATLDEAVGAFSRSEVLRDALGQALFETIIAVRDAEIARFADASDQDIVAATLWRH